MTEAHTVKRPSLSRIVRVVQWSAYCLWVGLLAARVALLIALLLIVLVNMVISRAHAAPRDIRAERRAIVQRLLTAPTAKSEAISVRGNCATGKAPRAVIQGRAAGLGDLPDAAEYCVTALTRLGRDRSLGYVRDPRSNVLTPALAFDNGFVEAYRKREPVAVGIPSMAALKPTAEQCLGQQQPDTDLCFSVGYAYGVRAAHGEVVAAR